MAAHASVVWLNGELVAAGSEVCLSHNDRVFIGSVEDAANPKNGDGAFFRFVTHESNDPTVHATWQDAVDELSLKQMQS